MEQRGATLSLEQPGKVILKGALHSILEYEVEFTHHEEYHSVCENSCTMSPVVLEGEFKK